MRNIFLYITTLLIPFLGFTQTQIKVDFKFDNYAQETSWEILDAYGDTLAFALPGDYWFGQADTTIFIDSVVNGTYTLNVYDAFSDGYCCPGGSITVTDTSCADTLAFIEDDFGALYTQTLIIAPCAPPVGGCLDTLALNYDSLSDFDDGSCVYPPCNGLDTFWVETYCNVAGNVVYYHWSNMANLSCRMASYTKSDNPYDLGNNWYPYPGNFSNTGLMYSNQQPNTTYYFLGMLADSSYTDTLVITTGECILGCTDPTALNYNPWANTPDGSCQAPPANCINGESNIVVTVIPDTYPGETSWEITDTNGIVLVSSPSYSITGVPIITETCVPNGTVINFNLYDGFGDGMCGTCYGGVDGTVLVQTLCGDTIMAILPGNADFGMDTSVTYTVQPCTPNSIPGCTTPGFTEYNPQANTDDGSCLTPVVLGCTDITSPDYDSSANTMSLVPNCDYTLVITDGAQDGWFGSWLGVLQGTTILGPYTMGPSDGASNSYTINLSSSSPVDIMFFTQGNSETTANQCGFYLIGPEGDTTLSGGTNSWTDPMIQFPYKYNSIPQCGNYCTPGILGCMDVTALNYNSLANMPDGNCITIVLGCTNTLAFNYDPLANVDDGNCVATIIGCMDSTAFNFNPSANTNDPSSCIPVILGCMDDTMFNYNAAANTEDGSCYPIVFGCTDILAFNYDPPANTNNGSCVPVILGCTDQTAFNFNVSANTNDNSCVSVVIGCTDPTALNFDSTANTNSGCVYPILGCTDPIAFNYDVNANTDDGTCVSVVIGCTDITAMNYDSLANTNSGCIYPILGCTNPTAFNFNVNANTDDGSCMPVVIGCTDQTALNYDSLANTNSGCVYPFLGCTDPTMFNFNVNANVNDGSCVPFINGCTDNTMFNYNPTANTDNGSCITFIYGCTDTSAFNYDPVANADNGTCVSVIEGCTDPTALNFNPSANTDDFSCVAYIYGCTDSTMFNYNPLVNTDNGSCVAYIYGCTDVTASNWNPLSNTNDNSCYYNPGCTDPLYLEFYNQGFTADFDNGSCLNLVVYGCMDNTMFNYNPTVNVDNGSCVPFTYGCTDSLMFNYDPLANTDNGSCVPFMYGCMDNTMFNYDVSANTNQVSETDITNPCIPFMYGCMDSTAFNYDPLVNTDNGTCIATVLGCTDGYDFQGYLYSTYTNYIPGFSTVTVNNYDQNANTDDGSCLYYDVNTVTGVGLPYWLNDTCYAWVVYEVDPYCLNNQWDAFCQSQYDYCTFGSPLGLEDMGRNKVVVYPNPTRDKINIKTKEDIDVNVYDMFGNHLIYKEKAKEIDMINLPAGIYDLRITFRGMIINHKVIKQ